LVAADAEAAAEYAPGHDVLKLRGTSSRFLSESPRIVTEILNSSTLVDISKILVYIYVDGIFLMKTQVLSLSKQNDSTNLKYP
jgi:hypothetical protein